jgi:hypothetical protein
MGQLETHIHRGRRSPNGSCSVVHAGAKRTVVHSQWHSLAWKNGQQRTPEQGLWVPHGDLAGCGTSYMDQAASKSPGSPGCKISTEIYDLQVTEIYKLITQYGDWSRLRILEIQLYDRKLASPHSFPPGRISKSRGFPLHEIPWPGTIPTAAQCVALLEAIPNLDMLKLIGDTSGRVFLGALSGLTPHGHKLKDDKRNSVRNYQTNNRGLAPKHCPTLQTLHLHSMSLALGSGPWPRRPSMVVNRVSDLLQVVLRSRRAQELPIHNLNVTRAEL